MQRQNCQSNVYLIHSQSFSETEYLPIGNPVRSSLHSLESKHGGVFRTTVTVGTSHGSIRLMMLHPKKENNKKDMEYRIDFTSLLPRPSPARPKRSEKTPGRSQTWWSSPRELRPPPACCWPRLPA